MSTKVTLHQFNVRGINSETPSVVHCISFIVCTSTVAVSNISADARFLCDKSFHTRRNDNRDSLHNEITGLENLNIFYRGINVSAVLHATLFSAKWCRSFILCPLEEGNSYFINFNDVSGNSRVFGME